MRLLLKCIECEPDDGLTERESMIEDIRDDGQYNVVCPNGHKTTIMSSNFKFELLFESAALALLDGYTFEAVASMHAAFERLLEFYIRVVSMKHGIQQEELDKNWNNVKSQSERQIGAFLFLYLLDNGKAPPIISKRLSVLSEFRNRVIHKGEIPTREEVTKHGETILEFMSTVYKELLLHDEPAVKEFELQMLFSRMGPLNMVNDEGQRVTYKIRTIVNTASHSDPSTKVTFQGQLTELAQFRHSRYGH